MKRSVFVICPVSIATPEVAARLQAYADMLEDNGVEVHLPQRDTNQLQNAFSICRENATAIKLSTEIHIFYNRMSKGTHFDLGVAFCMDQIFGNKKIIKLVSVSNAGKESSQYGFESMIDQWINDKIRNGEQEVEFEYQFD